MLISTLEHTLSKRLDAGIAAHSAGRLAEAEACYLEVLAQAPVYADTMRYLGVLRHQQDRSAEGIDWLQRSLALAPAAATYNDLGNILTQLGQLQNASEAFLAAVEHDANDPNHWNNLGAVLRRLERHGDAEEAFRAALLAAPDFVPALNNLGDLLTARDQAEAAAEYYCRAFIQPPLEGKSLQMLGIAYYRLGDIAAAAEAYRQWSETEPDNPRAQHMYLACLGGHGPERASDAFVEKTFDAHAEEFEHRLVDVLGYRGPEQIVQLLARHRAPERKLQVLDGGCGTGLCGPVLRPYAAHLTGVDLSAGMLGKAAARTCYDSLEKVELTTHLAARPGHYDLVVMADTVIYFGDTSALFGAVALALKPQGLFAFTIETSTDIVDYRITPSGRYQHATRHISECLSRFGLHSIAAETATLRTEFGTPVEGIVVLAERR